MDTEQQVSPHIQEAPRQPRHSTATDSCQSASEANCMYLEMEQGIGHVQAGFPALSPQNHSLPAISHKCWPWCLGFQMPASTQASPFISRVLLLGHYRLKLCLFTIAWSRQNNGPPKMCQSEPVSMYLPWQQETLQM